MKRHVETDPETGVEIFQLTGGEGDSHTIYGEQPPSDAAGGRILVTGARGTAGRGGRLSLIDLENGAVSPVPGTDTSPGVAAWHAWGEYFFYRTRDEKGRLCLVRMSYRSPERREYPLDLPADAVLSHGTVSSDGHWYACTVAPAGSPPSPAPADQRVQLFDLESGVSSVALAVPAGWRLTHEQFSLPGAGRGHRLMLQVNQVESAARPGERDVRLGVLEVPGDDSLRWLPVSYPRTLRCSGHQCWVAGDRRVVLSVMMDEAAWGNLWLADLEAPEPRAVCRNHTYFGHVAASRCGRYWLADGYHEPGTPIYAGTFDNEKYRRLCQSWTVFRGQGQFGHTHLYLTADNRHLVFTSARTGVSQVYAAVVPPDFWASLSTEGSLVERPAPEWSGDREEKRRWTILPG